MKRMAVCLAVFGLASGLLSSQSISMKIGLFVPQLRSELWEINLENLTFGRADMTNVVYSGEYEFYFDRHVSLALELGSYSKTVFAEYKDYTMENGAPIYQNLSLRIVPIEACLKLYPLGHRRGVSPFLGFGAGVFAWTYQQWGDFINFEDGSVTGGFAETRRFGFGLNGRLGLVFRFQSRLAFLLEGKYQYLKGRLSEYFQDFDRLDMGGFTANAGIIIYFR